MVRQVDIVPHTHWDREWYKPFPVFRMQLVELIDLLLPELEAGDGFDHFQLDGQMALVEDYLEIRPARRELLGRLNRSGKVTMGPWYTLPDEFLVSGETLVRDLALGIAAADALGGPMEIGYLPDMFGHVAQMPQILAGFGFDDAVVWRGVPSAIEAPAFDWEAPDGTTVRAEYLCEGYGNGAHLPETGTGLVDQVRAFVALEGPLVGERILWMNGTDHQLPQPHLGRVVAEANDAQDEYRFGVTSLADHLSKVPRSGLDRWRGELRSGARANLLMGTASCRVDVKQAAARAERSLERVAEPLAALWLPTEAWPAAFFEVAWREVVRNAAHDSICGCSADEVNDAVLHRYAEATRVAEQVADRALVRVLAESAQVAVAVNPTARTRAATATAIVEGDVAPPDTQQISVRPATTLVAELDAVAAVSVVERAAFDDPKVSSVTLVPAEDGSGDWTVTVHADRGPATLDRLDLTARMRAIAEDPTSGRVRVESRRSGPTQEVLLRTGPVPGFGWKGLAAAPLGDRRVRVDGPVITNGLVRVEIDPTDGTFAVDGVTGFGRLVDDGDDGDTYNWSPPSGDLVVDEPTDVAVTTLEEGPVRARVNIDRTYRWPEAVVEGRRSGSVDVVVSTVVELHAGEDLVRVAVSFDNRCRDHRLRMMLPLPEPAERSSAECAFTVVERGLVAEGGPNEAALPTFPSRRFVSAGGLLVVHEGLCEYELVDVSAEASPPVASTLALTLLRSVGAISKGPMTMRALPAGPPTPTPAAQLPGRHEANLVIHLGGRDPYAVADEAFTPVLTARRSAGFGDPSASGRALEVDGAQVSALLRDAEGKLTLRVFGTGETASTLTVAGRTGEHVDLRGRPSGVRFDGSVAIPPWRILTLRLD